MTDRESQRNRRTDPGGTTTYDYDVFSNLLGVTTPTDTITYDVDAQNRRIGKSVNGTFTQGLIYKDQLNPVAELDATGAVVSEFVYALEPFSPAYMIQGTNTYRIVTDHVGSIRLVIDTATGAVVQRMDYDEWGNVTLDTSPGFQPFGFAGGLHDNDTGLTRFGARDYDATTGRWTTKDPIGLAGGFNTYLYAKANPVRFVDPYGLFNFAKGFTAIGNAAIGAFTGVSGAARLAVAAGVLPASATGVGAIPPVVLGVWGYWNLKSSLAAWERAGQLWDEAVAEEWNQASWQNLYGLLPSGTSYDDACDPYSNPVDFIRDRGLWVFLSESGYF